MWRRRENASISKKRTSQTKQEFTPKIDLHNVNTCQRQNNKRMTQSFTFHSLIRHTFVSTAEVEMFVKEFRWKCFLLSNFLSLTQ